MSLFDTTARIREQILAEQGASGLVRADYRSTRAEGVADFAVGQYFTSAETGALRTYLRTNVAPFYQDQGDAAAPLSQQLLYRALPARDLSDFGAVYGFATDSTAAFVAACASGIPFVISGAIALGKAVIDASRVSLTLLSSGSIKFLQPPDLLSSMITFNGDDVSLHCDGLVDGNDTGCSLFQFNGARGFAHLPHVTGVSIKAGSKKFVSALDVRGPDFVGGVVDCSGFKRNAVPLDDIPSAPRAVSCQNNATNFFFEKIRAAGAESTDTFVTAGLASGHVGLLEGDGNVDNVFYAVGDEPAAVNAGRITFDRINCLNGRDEGVVVKNATQVHIGHLYVKGYVIAPIRYENHRSISIDTIEVDNGTSNTFIGCLIGSRTGHNNGGTVRIGRIIGASAMTFSFSLANGQLDSLEIGAVDFDILLDPSKTSARDGSAISYNLGRFAYLSNLARLVIGSLSLRFYDVPGAIPAATHIFTPISKTLAPGSRIGSLNVECYTGSPGATSPTTNFDHRCQFFLQPNLRIGGAIALDVIVGGAIYLVNKAAGSPRSGTQNTTNRDPRLANDPDAYLPVGELFRLADGTAPDVRYRVGIAGYAGTGSAPKLTWIVDGHVAVTTAQLSSLNDPVNTAGKYAGRQIWDSTAALPAVALGGSAASQWKYLGTGTTVTPA